MNRSAKASWLAALATLLVMSGVPAPAAAQHQLDAAPERVRLLENYSPLELGLGGAAAAGAIFFLAGGGEHTLGPPTPSMGSPEPGSVDWRYTYHVNARPDPEEKWLGGAPDGAGYALPAGALAFYGAGALGAAWAGGDSFLPDTRHELVAYSESLAWTMLTVNVLKYTVGRRRPFATRQDLSPEDFGESEGEWALSFPSGHAASAAVTATFLFWDISDYLVHEALADRGAVLRYGVGRAAPLAIAGGVTWSVMYSRIRDQRHWLSDTLIGAFIGASFATAFYAVHFDERGQPRRRRAVRGQGDEEVASGAFVSQHLVPVIWDGGRAGFSYGVQW